VPFVNVHMFAGRSVEQKRRLVRAITDAMVEHAGAGPEHLHVAVQEYATDNWGRGGILALDDAAKPRPTPDAVGQTSRADGAQPSDADAVSPGSLHHLLIECESLDATVGFYTDVVGIAVRARDTHRDGRPLVLTHNGIAFTSTSQVGRNVEHLAFPVRSVAAAVQRARSSGATVVRGPGPGPYGHTVYLADPDGNEVELFEEAG
jgi:4-oxalocrotonate tautomerase family enzyme